tara:strand:- start:1613 stop:2089 length:477 start_codon:yes stop_codon:yes gene_type:complete
MHRGSVFSVCGRLEHCTGIGFLFVLDQRLRPALSAPIGFTHKRLISLCTCVGFSVGYSSALTSAPPLQRPHHPRPHCNVRELCAFIEANIDAFNHINTATAFRCLLQLALCSTPREVVVKALQALERHAIDLVDRFAACYSSHFVPRRVKWSACFGCE